MSSILKALKKLEQEDPTRGSDIGEDFDPKKTLSRSAKERYLQVKFITISSVVFWMGMAILLIFSYPGLVNKLKMGKKTLPPGSKQESPVTISKKTFPPAIKHTRKSPSTEKTKFSTPSMDIMDTTVAPVKRITQGNARIMTSPHAPKTQTQFTVPERMSKTTELDLSALKLEAIVWARNPKSRFAVINGQIVRPGGYVGEFRLIRIGKDYVTLGVGNSRGKLGFRNR